MTTWTLVLMVFLGPWTIPSDVRTTLIPGFKSQADCMATGKAMQADISNLYDGIGNWPPKTLAKCIEQ